VPDVVTRAGEPAGRGLSPYPCVVFAVTGADGMPEAGGIGAGRTGPVPAGGRNGTSMAPVRPSPVISLDPVVRTARVGTEARPTSIATIST
jgi:hypothetical protein